MSNRSGSQSILDFVLASSNLKDIPVSQETQGTVKATLDGQTKIKVALEKARKQG